MKAAIFFLCALVLLGCNKTAQDIKWQGRCFPNEFLSEASFITSNNGDSAFDNDISNAPILYFPGPYVANHIPSFKTLGFIASGSQINLSLPVNFQPQRKLERRSDVENLEKFIDEKSLYISKVIEPYDFTLYTKDQDRYLYWGYCSGNSKTSYDCFRTIELEDMNLRYSVHKDNIATYKDIEDFIFEHLSMWECR
ncbi:MAG TPA: hypothetical protein DIC30_05115 [Oceanospirillales bacterium]|nr:hypothetical protein [Oceanospirillales bacterium]|tara:strand:- start:10407 stop:10994 length:588 start_codon:yes stop_codon:yes gene_type:complete